MNNENSTPPIFILIEFHNSFEEAREAAWKSINLQKRHFGKSIMFMIRERKYTVVWKLILKGAKLLKQLFVIIESFSLIGFYFKAKDKYF